MQEQYWIIGETAGKIYRALESSGEVTAAQLQKKIDFKDTAIFHQSLGWLAREGKVGFIRKGRQTVLSLLPSAVV